MRKSLGSLVVFLHLLSGSASAQYQFQPRPIPMGVAGGNSGYNTESVNPKCL
jgi:hypothetical protein